MSSCPRVKILTFDNELQCLLDSRSEVNLVTQSYFEKGILPKLGATDKAQMGAHNYFTLSAVNDGIIPISAYIELDIEFEGFLIKDVGFLVTKVPSTHLGRKRKLKTPGERGFLGSCVCSPVSKAFNTVMFCTSHCVVFMVIPLSHDWF